MKALAVAALLQIGIFAFLPGVILAQSGTSKSGQAAAQSAQPGSQPASPVTSLLGRVLLSRPVDAAVDSIRSLLDRQPEDTALLIAAGQAYDRVWHFGESIAAYTRAIALSPAKPRALSLRGQRHISIRQFDKAIVDLEQARELAPRAFHPLFHLGLAYYFTGRYSEAASVFGVCMDTPQKGAQQVVRKNAGGTLRQCDNLYDGQRFALASWRSLSLAREGKTAEARALLERLPVSPRVRQGDGQWYFDVVDMTLGRMSDSLWSISGENGGGVLTVGYALANVAFFRGDTPKGCRILRELLTREEWPAFGYIGAEVDLARGRCHSVPVKRPLKNRVLPQ